MSSIYDKASLVLIPSGTKTSKVYSQKPVSGDGDFTFSRSTMATRVNSSGNIEKETQNLLLQSNSFDTTWVNSNSTETGGQSGYDGSLDAWKIDITGAGGRIYQSVSQSGVSTYSIYAKAGSLNFIILSSNLADASFDLSNGLKGTLVNGVSSSIESIGGGWYRCSLVLNGSLTQVRVYPSNADNDFTSTSGNILIQDAQLEQGLVARNVITTTTTAVEGGITDNVPRLDYSGGATCPSLLLEPQRTNAITGSEYFDGGNLLDTNLTTAYNTADTLSPEGLYNAAKITATGNFPRYYGFPTIGDNVDVTLSAFAKAGSASVITIRAVAKSGQSAVVNFDLSAGTAELSQYDALTPSFDIIDMGNDWYRCSMTTNTGSGGTTFQTRPISHASGETGGWSGSNYIYAYGAQMEEASYATSYIPTYGSAVTRNADAASKTGISSLIGQTEGSLFVEAKPIEANGEAYYQTSISDGTNNNAGLLSFTNTSGQIRLRFENGGAVQAEIFANGIDTSNSVKMAMAYKANDFVLYVNGVQAGTDTSGSIPSFSQFQFANGGNNVTQMYGSVNQVLLFKTRLTNTELADLTTL